VASFPSSVPHEQGFSALAKALSPAPVQVTFCAANALPFRVEWMSPRGPVMFYGLSPDEAAAEAQSALLRGSVLAPVHKAPVTEPSGNSAFAEAMRELIADVEEQRREKQRPQLRLVRS
jgi:hypothetical protein